VNLAITDAPYTGIQTRLADAKTNLYTVNPTYLASNPGSVPRGERSGRAGRPSVRR
jgi:hypothetical protein